jgi:transcriptional regulator with XRE-family HTH domain
MVTNLRTIRKARNMTQRDLAAASGIHEITISKYESGKVDPSITNTEKLANALNCSINDLIGRNEQGEAVNA